MKEITKSIDIGGREVTFSTGKYAKQASAAFIVTQGESMLLCTAVCTKAWRAMDFLPLTIDYQDRNGANGTIPGGYLKREGRSSERETLASRVIDRSIRPMFPKNFRDELQGIATAMSYDADAETDVLALNGLSAAFYCSNAPMVEPIGAVRIVRVDGEFKLNPNFEDAQNADINLIVAGTKTSITMVEGGAQEAEDQAMLDAFEICQAKIKEICELIEALNTEIGNAKIEVPPAPEADAKIEKAIFKSGKKPLVKALAVAEKHARSAALKEARDAQIEKLVAKVEDADEIARITSEAKNAWGKLLKTHMRTTVIETKTRIDGRAPDKIRDIWCEVGLSPRAHGSAMFTRGETQGYINIALGTEPDRQRMELPYDRDHERWFMLTYNFAPFCTGEARPLRGPKRREIGHGALARRAILPVLPSKEDFPYVMRSTSEILESNGSSSMATVCGTSLALMDAGVPVKSAVAGIAMGLIKEGDEYVVLSDILGDEDHLGDMDFKVTGTEKGITAFQMDCKIAGVSREIMAAAIEQAKAGRLHILAEMNKALGAPRDDLSPYAPRITTLHIKTDKIRDIIGPGGKVIRGIQDACDVRIKVDDSGRVDVASNNQANTDKAIQMIREITQEAEIGALYVGVVKRITDFGAFVEIFPGTDGLIHISHLAHERVDKVTDVVHEGDEVLVRVIDVDRSGKIRLSRKEALSSMGA